VDAGEAGRLDEVLAPAVHAAFADQRLGDVVDHERQLREPPREHRHVTQVAGAEQQVERHALPFELAQPPQHGVAHEPVVVGLVVGDVADAHERRVAPQLRDHLGAALAGQVHPAHHARQETAPLAQLERPARLLEAVAGLDEDRPVDPRFEQQRLEVAGQVVPAQRLELRPAHPGVVEAGQIPEVLVRVDHRGHEQGLLQSGFYGISTIALISPPSRLA